MTTHGHESEEQSEADVDEVVAILSKGAHGSEKCLDEAAKGRPANIVPCCSFSCGSRSGLWRFVRIHVEINSCKSV